MLHKVYHLTTRENFNEITRVGEILPRSRLDAGRFQDLADATILESRDRVQLSAGLKPREHVPLVFDLVQPMFVRLVALNLIPIEDVLAIEFTMDEVLNARRGAPCLFFSHNLADSLSKPFELYALDDVVSRVKQSVWYDVADEGKRTLGMRQRQAEMLVPYAIGVELVTSVIAVVDSENPSAIEFRRAVRIARRRDGW